MKKKKKLPVNVKVPIYTYSYYGFPHSIIAAEEYVGKHVAKLEIEESKQETWCQQLGDFSVKEKGDFFDFYADHPYKENLYGVIYRSSKVVDAIRVRIHYQQYAHPWGAVNLFFDDSLEKDLALGDDAYLCRFGFFNREGVYLRFKNEPQRLEYNMRLFPIDLMLCRDHDIVEAYLYDGEERYLLWQKEISGLAMKDLKIGVQVRGNENTYYPWLYRNFIQISCDVQDVDRTMDYFYGVEKDWRFDWHNYFLNSHKVSLNLINHYGVIKYLKERIEEGEYIEVCLDQYHVANRAEFHMIHHLHQNLIFGYDDVKKIFCLLGYTDHGNLTTTEISYQDIKYQFAKKKCVSDIYIIEYEQDAYGMQYQEEYLKKMIRQYCEGYNNSFDLANMIEPRKRVYGIHCYDALLSEKGMKRILKDRRVLHLLYEHKALMKERLEYMQYHNAFDVIQYEKCLSDYDEVVRIAFNIRSLSVKYGMTGDESIVKKIRDGLITMCSIEKEVLTRLVP